MSTCELWHNPRCSKSREALALLRARGIEPAIREYLAEPPSAPELARLCGLLGLPARDLLRTGEPEYAALVLDDPALSEARLLEAIAAHPRLLERPILVAGGRAVVGRPPERVLELL